MNVIPSDELGNYFPYYFLFQSMRNAVRTKKKVY